MVSEVQSLVGRLHCSGPKVSRTSWRKVVGKGKLLNPWVRSRESLSERSHGKHKPQGHVPSDLLPPVTPHLPLLPTSPFKLIIHQMHWPTDYVTILIIHSLHLWTFLHCLKHEFLGTPPIPTVMRTISRVQITTSTSFLGSPSRLQRPRAIPPNSQAPAIWLPEPQCPEPQGLPHIGLCVGSGANTYCSQALGCPPWSPVDIWLSCLGSFICLKERTLQRLSASYWQISTPGNGWMAHKFWLFLMDSH